MQQHWIWSQCPALGTVLYIPPTPQPSTCYGAVAECKVSLCCLCKIFQWSQSINQRKSKMFTKSTSPAKLN